MIGIYLGYPYNFQINCSFKAFWRQVKKCVPTIESGINTGLRLLKSVMHKKIKISVIWWGEGMFIQGLCLLFLPNVPGATFIPGATSIPDSRVGFEFASYIPILNDFCAL